MTSNALVTRATVSELIQCYEAAKLDVVAGFEMLQKAQKSLDDRFKLGGHGGVSIYLGKSGHRSADELNIAYALKEMEKQAWRSIVDRLDIWRIMSETRAKELREHIDNGTLPELSEETAMQLAAAYIGNVDTLIDELTREVFDWLRPRVDEDGRTYNGGQYKTNEREIIGSRVIRSYMIKRTYGGGFCVHGCDSSQRLQTLENLFKAFDGKGTTGSGYYSDLRNAIEQSKNGTGETEYFRFKCCKNGNLHIEFLRADLFAELNRRAGGKNFGKGKTK